VGAGTAGGFRGEPRSGGLGRALAVGQIALAAKITHVPSLLLSERPGPLHGLRNDAIASLKEIGRRADERGVDTFLVFDTHWLSNFGFHLNANARHKGVYTSHEAPHMIQNLTYDLPGNPELGQITVEFHLAN
jgi:3,4-dihydroxyphenylacetate 2,3-dioxygenase